MAKLVAPLFSLTASGLVGPRLVFSGRKSGQQVRFQVAQKDVITPARTTQRDKYAVCSTLYAGLPAGIKEVIRWVCPGLNYTGFNLFMKNCLNGENVEYSLSYYGYRRYGIYKYGRLV